MTRRSIRPASGLAAPVARFLKRFRHEGGAVAIWFAVLALPLAVLSFGLIDLNRAGVEKRHLQDALDAATLLAARSTSVTSEQMQAIGSAALTAELSGVTDARLESSTFTITGTKITGAATAKVTPVIANLWIGGDMTVSANAEVVRSSKNLEVAMVLDITGSMEPNGKIQAMQSAAKDMIDLVVQDVQTPFYSKAAIVPFSAAVNAGSYAATARGAVTGTKGITGASWQSGVEKSVGSISKSNSRVTITSNAHGFNDGDIVYISGVSGMTQINDRYFTVSNKATNTFRLSGIDSSTFNSWTSGGKIRKCQVSDCSVVITANGHGYVNGDIIYIDGVQGMTGLNGKLYTVANRATNTFSLAGATGASYAAYTGPSGTAYCTKQGCEYYIFTNASGSAKMFQITDCVTERTGTNKATDVAPGTALVGRYYAGAACPNAEMIPLSTDKTALKQLITDFPAVGTTAGQIGAAWGWYMVSPTFGAIFPPESRPSAYGAADTLKVVVFMTDGEFNTAYCNGVLSDDSTGSNSNQINCNATNGNGTVQAQAICTAMKAKGVIVYTVGFDIGADLVAKDFIEKCATSSANVYLPSTGATLKDAFAAIGRDIMKLRLSK
ncbi:MAG: ubiquitin-activating E1 FCCH domain-containing protein [Pseudomonadota bacterium]